MRTHTFRSQPFDLAVDTISEAQIDRLVKWMREYPRLTMADQTRLFETAWAKWLGVKYCVMCNSGSSANLLMYAALESAAKGRPLKVVVPATGWVTTVAPAIQLGFKPIMCESDARTFGLDMDRLEEIAAKQRPDAVMVVHTLGVPADMTRLCALRRKYGFDILEDCCASHGARHKGKMVGKFGLMSSFSYYYGHHMSTVEGGIVCTNDKPTYYRLLMLRSHGWLKDLPVREADRLRKKYGVDGYRHPFIFVLPGYNLRPTDISATIGLIQLPTLNRTIRRRIANHRVYQERLRGAFEFAEGLPGDVISSISFCALAADAGQRRRIVGALKANAVDTRLFTAGNLGRHPFWTERYGVFSAPVADRLYERGFFLPNNQSLDRKSVNAICDVVLAAVSRR